ncbi:Hsk1-interacting molecule 1 [Pleurostoma richardsiae]|uniref:Hsk1-interacting molecule 1 n=1 Tax=Pleurostoma richardsiae TaxID=41990 RepID=A0AA38VU83_9PEZI|nr:Hsk1-interacting molecule 1 [Pleurostoma richardsiae]
MSTRRVPLSANPNVANSPVRGVAALAAASKQKRSYANLQREEAYGQPPPAKKQVLDHGSQRVARSPTRQASRPALQRGTAKAYTADRVSQQPAAQKLSEEDVEQLRKWQAHQRTRFPKLVFYFESIPDDQRSRLAKHVAHLGAREEKFFSINITHVVTTRPIPAEKTAREQEEAAEASHEPRGHNDEPQTINPSLLSRHNELENPSIRRRLFETGSTRRMPVQAQDSVIRQPKSTRSSDVLVRAREMGKKIWSLDKLQRMLDMLLEPDPYKSASYSYGSRTSGHGAVSTSRAPDGTSLLQLLNKERVNGPSDRDPTVATKELNYFKGPYVYVYDIEEKQKPIMVREYARVADKKDGDWPQFRASANGRCPFIEDYEPAEKESRKTREKERAAKAAAVETAPKLQPPEVPPPKPVTGKRSLTEMEDGHNRGAGATVRPTEIFEPSKAANQPTVDFDPQNAFTSRARAGRLFAGEPVASGVQPSNITSAIRSQMISSNAGSLGPKAGTSKEVHGLQRKVLQKSAPTSQDLSSRRLAEMSLENGTSTRSGSLGRASSRKLDMIEEDDSHRTDRHKRTVSVPAQAPAPKPKKRDPKPGYCENCQDKFEDFDDHILSRKHRKFAENNDNWAQLDALLGQLKRLPRFSSDRDELGDDEW